MDTAHILTNSMNFRDDCLNDLEVQRLVAESFDEVEEDDIDYSSEAIVTPPPAKDCRLYTVGCVAELTGRSRSQIYRMIERGDFLPCMAPHGAIKWLIRAEDVKRLMHTTSDQESAAGSVMTHGERS